MVVTQIDLPSADPAAADGLLHLDPAEHPAAIGARVVGQIQAGLDHAAEKFGVGEPDPLDLLLIGLGGGVPETAHDRRLQPITAIRIYRKRVDEGKSVYVSVDLGGHRLL